MNFTSRARAAHNAAKDAAELPMDTRLRRTELSLSGDNLQALEALAWGHLFGLVMALKKGRCTKALGNLRASVEAELAKGPLEAHGYAHKGYGAIAEFIGWVRSDMGIFSRRSTAYRREIGDYSHSASFFWYQLQHLTDIPAYRDDAAAKCEAHITKLIGMEP